MWSDNYMDYGEFFGLSNREDWSDQYVNKLWDTIEKLQSMTIQEFESNSINYDNIYEFWKMKDRDAIVLYSQGSNMSIFINFHYMTKFPNGGYRDGVKGDGLSYLILYVKFKNKRFNIIDLELHDGISLSQLSHHLKRNRWAVLRNDDITTPWLNWLDVNPFEVKQ